MSICEILGTLGCGTLGTLDPEIYIYHGTLGTQDPEMYLYLTWDPGNPGSWNVYWTWDPGNLGSWNVYLTWDLGNPGSWNVYLTRDLGNPGSWNVYLTRDIEDLGPWFFVMAHVWSWPFLLQMLQVSSYTTFFCVQSPENPDLHVWHLCPPGHLGLLSEERTSLFFSFWSFFHAILTFKPDFFTLLFTLHKSSSSM